MLDDFSSYRINCIFLKPTLCCNLKCDYCYSYLKLDKSRLENVMSLSTIERVISEYMKTAVADNHQNINLVWHGGEPLLVGLDFFKKCIEIEKRYAKSRIKINNYIQTNGVLVDEKWAKFFKENGFSVGVSIDGPRKVNDLHRNDEKGKSNFNSILKGIKILQEKGVPTGALSVITEKNYIYVNEIFNFFQELGLPLVDFTPCLYYRDDSLNLSPTPEHFGEFLIAIFDLWKANPKKFNITFLDDLSKKVKEYKGNIQEPYTTNCELSGQCGRQLTIMPNGDVYPCECLINIDYMKLVNINESTLSEILKSDSFENFKRIVNQLNESCFKCKYFKICKGGCLHRRLPERTTIAGKDYHCQSKKMIIEHILGRVND